MEQIRIDLILGDIESRSKCLVRRALGKELGIKVVEDCPQLDEIVLCWSSTQQKPAFRVDTADAVRDERLVILDDVTFVQNA